MMRKLGDLSMLSFEQKKTIFRSFQELQEKPISNNRINYIYPDSVQRGKMLATQLQPSGNGYVIGKYIDGETIRTKGYVMDNRGWVNIKEFSSGDLQEIITTAMRSMSGQETKHYSNALNVKQDRNEAMIEKANQERQSEPLVEGGVGSYLYNWLHFGIISVPIWFQKSENEILKIQTKIFEQGLEFMQSITNIWTSAMFGTIDLEKQ
jgi:hypothetical protein